MSSKKAAGAVSETLLKLTIAAGGATPSPPIGPALGQKGVKAIDFCKQFNDQSSKTFLPSIPLLVRILVKSDRTFSFTIKPPSTTYLLKNACGLLDRPLSTQQYISEISPQQLYEIAKVKHADPGLMHLSLHAVFRTVVSLARNNGLKIVRPVLSSN